RNSEPCYEIRQAKQQSLASAALEQLADGRAVRRRRRELSCGARLVFAQGEAAIALGKYRVLPGGKFRSCAVSRVAHQTPLPSERQHAPRGREPARLCHRQSVIHYMQRRAAAFQVGQPISGERRGSTNSVGHGVPLAAVTSIRIKSGNRWG